MTLARVKVAKARVSSGSILQYQIWRSCRTHTYTQHLLLFYNEQHKQILVRTLFCVLPRRFLMARRTSAALSVTPLPFHPTYLSLWIFHAPLHTKLPFPKRCNPPSFFFFVESSSECFPCRRLAKVPKTSLCSCSHGWRGVNRKGGPLSTESRWQHGEKETEGRSPRTVGNVLIQGSCCWFLFFIFEQQWCHFPLQEGHKKIFGALICTLMLYRGKICITDSQQNILQATSLKPWCVYDLQKKVFASSVERNKTSFEQRVFLAAKTDLAQTYFFSFSFFLL